GMLEHYVTHGEAAQRVTQERVFFQCLNRASGVVVEFTRFVECIELHRKGQIFSQSELATRFGGVDGCCQSERARHATRRLAARGVGKPRREPFGTSRYHEMHEVA